MEIFKLMLDSPTHASVFGLNVYTYYSHVPYSLYVTQFIIFGVLVTTNLMQVSQKKPAGADALQKKPACAPRFLKRRPSSAAPGEKTGKAAKAAQKVKAAPEETAEPDGTPAKDETAAKDESAAPREKTAPEEVTAPEEMAAKDESAAPAEKAARKPRTKAAPAKDESVAPAEEAAHKGNEAAPKEKHAAPKAEAKEAAPKAKAVSVERVSAHVLTPYTEMGSAPMDLSEIGESGWERHV